MNELSPCVKYVSDDCIRDWYSSRWCTEMRLALPLAVIVDVEFDDATDVPCVVGFDTDRQGNTS